MRKYNQAVVASDVLNSYIAACEAKFGNDIDYDNVVKSSAVTKSSDELKTYLFTYKYDGSDYALRVPALSQQEAAGRVRRMSSAVYDGEVIARIPTIAAWPARTLIFVRNLFHPRFQPGKR